MSTSAIPTPDPATSLPSSKPAIPDPYDLKDPAAVAQIKKRTDERWKTANHRRWLFEVGWLRQVLFALDIQWVRVDYSSREVRNVTLPNNFPRAITNKYAQVNGDLWAQLVQGDIPINWLPSTDDMKDQSTADICERIREVIDVETKVRQIKRDLGFWETYTGNAFIEVEYDYSPTNGTVPVPLSQCDGCGMTSKVGEMDGGGDPTQAKPCPQCTVQSAISGGPPATPSYSPAMGDDGQPQTEDVPIGRLTFNSLSPFEVYQDNICRIGSTPGQQWYFKPRRYDVSVAKEMWKDFAGKLNENMNEPMKPSRNYLIAIAYAGSYLSGTTGTGEASAREEMRKQLTAWQYKEMPTPEYPQGVYAVRVGDEIVELKPLPNTWGAGQLQGQPFLGLVQFYQEISGGAWSKARASRLIGIQVRRNIIESNLQLTAQRTGAPKLMSPYGSGLKNMTGEAGQFIEYKPITFGGTSVAEPKYLEAALGNVQPLLELIKQLDDMQETIAGTHSVTGGDTPPGVTAASALAFLSEKANRAISPLKESWAECWGTVYQYAIEIARQHWTDERILAILGRNKEWQFEKFKGSDLTGAVNVSIDYEALFPKSQATERANILQLVQMGVIQPAADPEQNYEVLARFGATDLKASQDDAIMQARREWDAFLLQQKPPVLKPLVQNAPLHLMQHKRDAQTQEYEQLDPNVQAIWDAHIQATATEVMIASMPMGPDAGPGGPPPPHGAPPAGHPGSQKGSQAGAAHGNLANAAPIRKGEAAADGGQGPAGPTPA